MKRLYALDVLRGLTVAAMIIVNNAGGSLSYSCLQHSEWNGMTLCDMVFPSFLFIVGITACISLRKTGYRWSWPVAWKIVRRTVLILLLGWGIHWLEHVCKGDFFPLGYLRLTGVLPRIAVCYCLCSCIALSCGRRAIAAIIVGLLAIYSWILLAGDGFLNDTCNVLSRVDRAIVGTDHLYTKRPIDPEGLLGTISALAHTLIGFCFGALLMGSGAPGKQKSIEGRLLALMSWGFALLLAGLALELAMPLNKRVWSPSFVLVSCGLVALALGLIAYLVDIKGEKGPFRPFDVFGVNPLFLYVLSEVTAIVLSATGAKRGIYAAINGLIADPYMASAVYSLLFVAVMLAVGYPLYRKKIYIKI